MSKPKDETVESTTDTPVKDASTKPDTEAPDANKQEGEEEISPATQAIIDKRIQREIKRVRAEHEAALAEDRKRLETEAREAQLLEKENFKELYESREAELAELKAERERAAMDAKTDTLLDNAGITSPALRALIKALPSDLEARAERVSELADVVDKETETRVSQRLHTDAPDKRRNAPGTKRLADMTYTEKAELRDKIGDEAFLQRVKEERSAVS